MKKTETESIPESIGGFLAWVLRVFTSISILLIFAVMPFYFQEGFTHIGSDKSYFYRTAASKMGKLILPVFALWLIFYVIDLIFKKERGSFRSLPGKFRLTDWCALCYGISAILSYIGTSYRETALWGTKGWYMGLIPQLTLVAVYFLVSRFQFETMAKYLFLLCMPVSAAVFLLALLNRFDLWPIPMENSGLPMFISTIGNINWFCGYAVTVGFVGVGILWLGRDVPRWCMWLSGIYVLLFFATMITQGSDSGIFALVVVFAAMFFCSARDGDELLLRRFWLSVLLLALAGMAVGGIRLLFPERINLTTSLGDLLSYSPLPFLIALPAGMGIWLGKNKKRYIQWMRGMAKALCAGIPLILILFVSMIALNTLRPGSLGALSGQAVFTFDDKWGSSRGASWSLGLKCFMEQDALHKLTGAGPDCMADFLYNVGENGGGASRELTAWAKEAFKNKRLTNAHNEFITVLVNMGILGLVSYAGMLLSAVVRFLRERKENVLAAACGLSVLAYIANNIWSFQQSMSLASIGVILGMGEWFWRRRKLRQPERSRGGGT